MIPRGMPYKDFVFWSMKLSVILHTNSCKTNAETKMNEKEVDSIIYHLIRKKLIHLTPIKLKNFYLCHNE
jgi:hypothetical protein